MALDSKPARLDLTDRECAKLLGGMIGALAEMAPLENVRAAIRWWAEHDDPWAALEHFLAADHAIPPSTPQ
jgi:hypothetical protein